MISRLNVKQQLEPSQPIHTDYEAELLKQVEYLIENYDVSTYSFKPEFWTGWIAVFDSLIIKLEVSDAEQTEPKAYEEIVAGRDQMKRCVPKSHEAMEALKLAWNRMMELYLPMKEGWKSRNQGPASMSPPIIHNLEDWNELHEAKAAYVAATWEKAALTDLLNYGHHRATAGKYKVLRSQGEEVPKEKSDYEQTLIDSMEKDLEASKKIRDGIISQGYWNEFLSHFGSAQKTGTMTEQMDRANQAEIDAYIEMITGREQTKEYKPKAQRALDIAKMAVHKATWLTQRLEEDRTSRKEEEVSNEDKIPFVQNFELWKELFEAKIALRVAQKEFWLTYSMTWYNYHRTFGGYYTMLYERRRRGR